ncbi:MAG: hypothetical protein HY904_10165 [Deltaproteobacteria bacterium]|nr:hypothetical protein [Deltaproteobacteria bacterium]
MTVVVLLGLGMQDAARPPKGGAAKAPEKAAPLSVGEGKVTQTPLGLDAVDEPRKAAEAYLKALSGQGDDTARDTLLGGATLNARLETLPNWKIVSREPGQVELGELADVATNMENLDKEGRMALAKMLGGGPASDPDGLSMQELDAEQAQQLLAPTKARAAAFQKSHPVFAYVARVDREVYWHPKNPVRKLIADAGSKGRYQLDFHLFKVEVLEGAQKKSRVWPLRLLRLRTDKLDTGWRVLPASDWNAE